MTRVMAESVMWLVVALLGAVTALGSIAALREWVSL